MAAGFAQEMLGTAWLITWAMELETTAP